MNHYLKNVIIAMVFIGLTIGLTACSFEPATTEWVKNRYKDNKIIFQTANNNNGTTYDYLICQEKNLIFVQVDSMWPISIEKETIIGGAKCE